MQAAAAEQLRATIAGRLGDARLTFERAAAYVTPRRLTLVVDGLPERQPDVVEERRGPHVGAPQRALEGFMKSAGVDSLDAFEVRRAGDADYYYLSRTVAGRATDGVLREIVAETIVAFSWPKSMRWGSGTMRWVRPLQNVLCLYAGRIVDVELPAHGLRANDATWGHRFMAPQRITVTSFGDYARALRDAFVILDPAERRAIIESRTAELAAAEGLAVTRRRRTARRSRGLGGVAGAAGRLDRRALHGRPARSDRADDAHEPEVRRARNARRRAGGALRRRRERRARRRRCRHRRRQRARAARPARRRPLLLGSGSQDTARYAGSEAGRPGLPREARFDRRQGTAARVPRAAHRRRDRCSFRRERR